MKNGFLRGGNWNNTDNAGAFALNLNNTPDNRNNNIGFRCASEPLTNQRSNIKDQNKNIFLICYYFACDMRLRMHIRGKQGSPYSLRPDLIGKK